MLTSSRNPLLKDVRRAVTRGGLTSGGFAVAEGVHLMEEALRSGRPISAVLAAASEAAAARERVAARPEVRVVALEDGLFREISSTEHSQGVITLVAPRQWTVEELFGEAPLVVALDGIQDPGNAGAVARAAEAFGASGIIFLRGSVSPHNPKTLRASAGSLFRTPFVEGYDGAAVRNEIRGRSLALYVATPRGGAVLGDANLRGGFALVLGSESRGVSEAFRAGATELRIPTAGVESLNVAVAAGIILYDAARQRSGRP
ncbi:MAG: RNA methyltransferase [Bryobacteraceae bacterium]|nr:RNA methyltransferase [Bryobacteraceae bacterium]